MLYFLRANTALCLLLALAIPGAAAGAATSALDGVTVRLHGSTLGLGAELGYRFDNGWGLRGGWQVGEVDPELEAEDGNGVEGDELDYDSDIDLSNGHLFADWHPWNGRFRVSAGLVYNDSDLKVVSRCNRPIFGCELGFSRFSPEVMGEVTTTIDFPSVVPALAIGWGHLSQSGWAFNVDLGIALLGEGDANLSSSGSCNQNAQCREQLKNEEEEIEKDLDEFELFPLLTLGVSYQF